MKQEKKQKNAKNSSKPEKITSAQSLSRMKDFSKRKEQIIAVIRESKN